MGTNICADPCHIDDDRAFCLTSVMEQADGQNEHDGQNEQDQNTNQ